MSKHTVASLVKHAGIAERSCVYVAGILRRIDVLTARVAPAPWLRRAQGVRWVAVLICGMSRFACFPHHRQGRFISQGCARQRSS